MQATFSMKYGTEHCKDVLAIALDSHLLSVDVTTDDGEKIALIVPATHMALLCNGIAQQLTEGETLWVVYNPLVVMAQMNSAARFAHLLYHMGRMGTNGEDFPPWNQEAHEAQKIANAERETRADIEDGTPDTQEPIDYDK